MNAYVYRARHILQLSVALLAAACTKHTPARDTYQGVVEYDERELGFEIPGKLREVLVTRGAAVTASQLLATLDDVLERTVQSSTESEARAASAQAALLQAGTRKEDIHAMESRVRATRAREALLEKDLARARALSATGSISNAALDDAQTRYLTTQAERQGLEFQLNALKRGPRREEVRSAEARAAAAQSAVHLENQRVVKHQLRAPADGIAVDVHLKSGEVVTPGMSVVTVADVAHPYADVFVPQRALASVRLGLGATVRTDAAKQACRGVVEDIGRQLEFTPRFIFSEQELPTLMTRVRVRIDNPQQALHAGVPVFVQFDSITSKQP